ncbi:MAG: hypothetical protein LBV60_15140 [Streptomyces sp.]|jgi:hypothetical protein|nr:hypothetical protein [Streptomyces sp.]
MRPQPGKVALAVASLRPEADVVPLGVGLVLPGNAEEMPARCVLSEGGIEGLDLVDEERPGLRPLLGGLDALYVGVGLDDLAVDAASHVLRVLRHITQLGRGLPDGFLARGRRPAASGTG